MRKKRGEIAGTITYSVACSENKVDPLETSKVKIENEHQNEDLAEVVADLKRQLLLSKFCIERFKNSDDIFFIRVFQITIL